jgi:hypothetical protein
LLQLNDGIELPFKEEQPTIRIRTGPTSDAKANVIVLEFNTSFVGREITSYKRSIELQYNLCDITLDMKITIQSESVAAQI